jgi:hypothetical protein
MGVWDGWFRYSPCCSSTAALKVNFHGGFNLWLPNCDVQSFFLSAHWALLVLGGRLVYAGRRSFGKVTGDLSIFLELQNCGKEWSWFMIYFIWFNF